MAPLFPSHGKYSLHRDGQVLVTEVVGPWNLELVQEWARSAIPFSIEMQEEGPWAGIAIMSESMLATPDAMAALRKVVAASVEQFNCIAHIVVAAPGVAGKGVVEGAFQKVYEGLCLSGFFDDYSSAKDWAIQQIDRIKVEQNKDTSKL